MHHLYQRSYGGWFQCVLDAPTVVSPARSWRQDICEDFIRRQKVSILPGDVDMVAQMEPAKVGCPLVGTVVDPDKVVRMSIAGGRPRL